MSYEKSTSLRYDADTNSSWIHIGLIPITFNFLTLIGLWLAQSFDPCLNINIGIYHTCRTVPTYA